MKLKADSRRLCKIYAIVAICFLTVILPVSSYDSVVLNETETSGNVSTGQPIDASNLQSVMSITLTSNTPIADNRLGAPDDIDRVLNEEQDNVVPVPSITPEIFRSFANPNPRIIERSNKIHNVISAESNNLFTGTNSEDNASVPATNAYVFVTKWGSDRYGDGQFSLPMSIAVDSEGNVYVADYNNDRIQKFNSNGTFITKWGTSGSADGQFSYPTNVAVDPVGNVYVADSVNDRIQKFSSTGTFITKWGTGGANDGDFAHPLGVAVDSAGSVYVADSRNHRIQKFGSTGTFLSKWGSEGSEDGQFSWPHGVTVDSAGNVYVADNGNNRIQKFSSAGVFITKWGTSGTGDGQFSNPSGIAVDLSGNTYVADAGNYRIQKFNSTGSFLAKWGSWGVSNGLFNHPCGVATDSSGNVYVSDEGNNRIQKFSSLGIFLGAWGGYNGDGQFNSPNGVAVDSLHNVYVADTFNNRIQKFNSTGSFISTCGSPGFGDGQFVYPYSLAFDSSGNVYVADSGYARIQKFSSNGTFITKWGTGGTGDGQFNYPKGIAVDSAGYIYVTDSINHRIQKFSSSGTFITKWGSVGGGEGQLNYPYGIAVDSVGDVYVADSGNNRIQKFTSTGTFIATWGTYGSGDGQLSQPAGVTVDSSGNVFVADSGNARVQKFSSTGTFITKWGTSGSGDGQLDYNQGIAVDTEGNVYVADTGNYRIQKFAPSYVNAPGAHFIGTPTSGTAPLTVHFTDNSTNIPTGWAWFFGDENFTAPWILVNAKAEWSPRVSQTSVVMADGSIVMMGGNLLNDTWRSTDYGAKWALMNGSPGWSARQGHTSVAMQDGSIVLMGGYGRDNPYHSGDVKNDTWRSTDNGANWTLMNISSGWSARSGQSSVVMSDGSIVLMGGYTGMHPYLNDVWCSKDNGATWTQVTPNAEWLGRSDHTSVVMPDNSIVLMGGGVDEDVWRSTDYGATWHQQIANAGWSGNYPQSTVVKPQYAHTSVIMPDNSIVLMGGTDGSGYPKNDVWRSTNSGVNWSLLNTSVGMPAKAWFSSLAMPDGSIVLLGGCGLNAGATNDVWKFIPAGSSVQNPTHTFTTPGNYTVTLQAYNDEGYNCTRKTGYITVSGPAAPVADFSGWPTQGNKPFPVIFTDLSTNTPTSWNWSFGDGSFSNLQNPRHVFTTRGNFTITLTASNAGGWDTRTRTNYINVRVLPLVSNFTGTPEYGVAPLTVTFTDYSTDSPNVWNWSFGDNQWFNTTNILQRNPVHTYTEQGKYTVALMVSNPNGTNTRTENGYIRVVENTSYRARLILPCASLYQNTPTKIPIQVANITSGTGLSFNMTYDPMVIRVNGITLNQSYATGSSLTVNSTPGLSRVTLTRTDGINIGSPTQLLMLDVSGTGAVGSSTQLSATSARWGTSDFGIQQFNVVNGTVIVYRIRGDLNGNGEVDVGDVAHVAYMGVNRAPSQIPEADFNGNEVIDVGDAAKIAWFSVGKITEL